jgi:hypothetical protein
MCGQTLLKKNKKSLPPSKSTQQITRWNMKEAWFATNAGLTLCATGERALHLTTTAKYAAGIAIRF